MAQGHDVRHSHEIRHIVHHRQHNRSTLHRLGRVSLNGAHVLEPLPHQAHHGYHRILNNVPAASPPAIKYSPGEIHKIIHKAADVAGVSPSLAGGIADFESMGLNPYAHNETSFGLFQMQRKTSDSICAKYGHEIAAALKETGDVRYAGLAANMSKPSPSFGNEYDKMKFDPYFNALLGTHLLKQNALDNGLDPKTTKDAARIYSLHLLGVNVGLGDMPLRSLPALLHHQDFIDSNINALGGPQKPPNPNPTVTEAHNALQKIMDCHIGKFVEGDKNLLGIHATDIWSPPVAHARSRKGHAIPGAYDSTARRGPVHQHPAV